MATRTVSVTLTGKVLSVEIDVQGQRLTLSGAIVVDGTSTQVQAYSEDVTALLNAEDVAAVTRIVTRAQAWIDGKLATL